MSNFKLLAVYLFHDIIIVEVTVSLTLRLDKTTVVHITRPQSNLLDFVFSETL